MINVAVPETEGESLSYIDPDRLSVIRDRIAGYADGSGDPPGSAVISELLQNADDAEATVVRFSFTQDYLEAYNNQFFSDENFLSIRQAFAASKRQISGKIGAFGTGFLSVYRITDQPQLYSAGQHLVFHPMDIKKYPTNVGQDTYFRFHWRKEQTEIGQEIEGKIWSDADIAQLKQNMGRLLYRMCLFLRHVCMIEVYDEQQQLLVRIHRRRVQIQHVEFDDCTLHRTGHDTYSLTSISDNPWGFTREYWIVRYCESGSKPKRDLWVYYRAEISPEHTIQDITIKDRQVALAFPCGESYWEQLAEPARLYNFLPTQIETELPFQINGAFFPDNNRQRILTGSTDKGDWNDLVISAIGELFAVALLNVRDVVADPDHFYKLLPLSFNDAYDFLAPIHEQFAEAADQHPIVYTSLNAWVRPSDVLVGSVTKLYQLIEPYLPLLPSSVDDTLRKFVSGRPNVKKLGLVDVLKYLQSLPELQSGCSMSQIPILNSPDKISILYKAAERAVEEPSVLALLQTLPLYPTQQEVLYRFNDDMWCGDEEVRQLHFDNLVRFVDVELQKNHQQFLTQILEDLDGPSLLTYVKETTSLTTTISLTDAPVFMNTPERLQQTLTFLHKSLAQLTINHFTGVLLVLDEQLRLWPIGGPGMIRLIDDDTHHDLLSKVGVTFVHPLLREHRESLAVYEWVGVQLVRPQDVITCLEHQNIATAQWSVEILRALFDYFYSHRQHMTSEVQRLRRLPIYLTQQGNLAPIERDGVRLKLPKDREVAQHLERLGIDTIIHTELQQSSSALFLLEVLGVEELSTFVAIRDDILTHYNEQQQSHMERMSLLGFIRTAYSTFSEEQRDVLAHSLQTIPLIRCEDNVYRAGSIVYFASSDLDNILTLGYHVPHNDYGIAKDTSTNSEWYLLFLKLGVRHDASEVDLIATIRELVNTEQPSESEVQKVKQIYHTINIGVGENKLYGDGRGFEELTDLKWLPAKNGRVIAWHYPSEVYQSNYQVLVGRQAPVLEGFAPTSGVLKTLWNMSGSPPVSLVVDHLQASAKEHRRIDDTVYIELGRHWTEIQEAVRHELANAAIVWDGNQYWQGQHVFLDDTRRHLFGGRRGSISRDIHSDAKAFLLHVGVQASWSWRDALAILEDVVADCAETGSMSKDARQLVLDLFAELDREEWDYQIGGTERTELRRQPIFLTKEDRFAPIEATDGTALMYEEGPLRRPVPAELLGNDRLLSRDLPKGGGGRFLQALGVEPLSHVAAISSYVPARYDSLSDDQKLRVLGFVRDVWFDLSDEARSEVLPYLTDVALIRCHDGLYWHDASIYFAATKLDKVLVQDYLRPHADYHILENEAPRSTWYSLFRALGVRENPAPTDLAESVTRLVSEGAPTEQSIRTIQDIYTMLNESLGDGKLYGDGEDLELLADTAWLPARNDTSRWFKPSEIYQARYRGIIGTQAPFMRFAETSTDLRTFLRMPGEPPVKLIVLHLLAQSQPVDNDAYRELGHRWREVDDDAYRELGRRWHEVEATVDQTLIDRLRQEPVIWDSRAKRYWRAAHVFFTNYSEFFGNFRYYPEPPGGDVQVFFAKIGANEYHKRATHIAFLLQLANEYQHDKISEALRNLIFVNLDHLGRQMGLGDVTPEEEELRSLCIIPGQDGKLHVPGKVALATQVQDEIQHLFGDAELPLVDDQKRDGVGLTFSAYTYLHRILHVPSLPEVLQHRLVESTGSRQDEDEQARLSAMVPVLTRVQQHLRNNLDDRYEDGELPLQDLEHIQVFTCNELQVEYSFPSEWNIPSRRQNDPAFYADHPPTLYIQQVSSRRNYVRSVAKLLARVCFNGHEKTTIAALLEMETIEEAHAYLNEFGYPGLLDDTIELVSWFEEPTSDVSPETDNEEEPTSDVSPETDNEEAVLETSDTEIPLDIIDDDEPSTTTSTSDTAKPTTEQREDDDTHDPEVISVDESLQLFEDNKNLDVGEDIQHGKGGAPKPANASPRNSSWIPAISPEKAKRKIKEFTPTSAVNDDRYDDEPDVRKGREPDGRSKKPRAEAQGSNHQDKMNIGLWGEKYVMAHLREELYARYPGELQMTGEKSFQIVRQGKTIVRVQWLNQGGDVGRGYDIHVEVHGRAIMFIEVKSTSAPTKDWFRITRPQWQAAHKFRNRFYIYCVHGAGTNEATITQIHNPVHLWEQDKLESNPVEIRI